MSTQQNDADVPPLLRLTAVRIVGRPTPLYVVQKRLTWTWGPQWLRAYVERALPYWALSGLHSQPQDACAEAFARCLMRGDDALAQAVVQLGQNATHTIQ